MKTIHRTLVSAFAALCIAGALSAAPEIIENKIFERGFVLKDRSHVILRHCTFMNREGRDGLLIENCSDVRIENCTVRRVGNETMPDKALRLYEGYPFAPLGSNGIYIVNSRNVTVVDTEVTDIFGRGIHVYAESPSRGGDITIERSRVAYTYDDGILFSTKGDQGDQSPPPMKGAIIRGNVIHDIALGLNRNGFARHGMYLKVRDAVVEDNVIFNVFYGEAISLRNSGIVRRNRIRNTLSTAIAYWAQTRTDGGTREVIIEDNVIEQTTRFSIPMRHISYPDRIHDRPFLGVVLQFPEYAPGGPPPAADIALMRVRNNTFIIGVDCLDESPVIQGNGPIETARAQIEIAGNTIDDRRAKQVPFARIPPKAELRDNRVVSNGR